MLRVQKSRSIELKSARELELMRESGKLVVQALNICRDMAKPGVRTIDIDKAVEAFYLEKNAISLFKGTLAKCHSQP